MQAQSPSESVCVWERVTAGSLSCVDILRLSALVERGKCSLCDVLCRGVWLSCRCNKEWGRFPAEDVNCSTAAGLVSLRLANLARHRQIQ